MENSFENHDQPEHDENILRSSNLHTQLPRDLEEKTVRQLKKKGLILSSWRRSYRLQWMKAAAAIIILAGMFIAGLFVGNRFPKGKQGVTSNTLGTYLLLLYNPDDFITGGPGHAKEYGAWLKDLTEKGLVADGEELNEKGWTVAMSNMAINMSSQPVHANQGKLSGYFIIKASSEEKALQVASSCPHLKYKGVIEVRPIKQSSH
ncbi:MAG TPA: hypothetical protein VLJ68_05990 [Chitinophagaceae bacterium]|nr:hypothetical protein [Chitinophagaceae bacterium]